MKIDIAISDILNGKPIIIVDDYNREDEGDLVIAASKATVENLAFMKRVAGGLMCVPTIGSILDRLQIPMMVENPTDPHGTPFTQTIDFMHGTSTGMSCSDRLELLKGLLDENSKPEDFSRPGHMFPLRPKEKLLLERRGHTEASIEIVKKARLPEIAVIIEVMNVDGSMSRLNDLEKIASQYNLNLISVEEIYEAVYNKGV